MEIPKDKLGLQTKDILSVVNFKCDPIKRIRLHYKGKPIQRNYFACWSKENTNYYIEEFVQIYKDLLHK